MSAAGQKRTREQRSQGGAPAAGEAPGAKAQAVEAAYPTLRAVLGGFEVELVAAGLHPEVATCSEFDAYKVNLAGEEVEPQGYIVMKAKSKEHGHILTAGQQELGGKEWQRVAGVGEQGEAVPLGGVAPDGAPWVLLKHARSTLLGAVNDGTPGLQHAVAVCLKRVFKALPVEAGVALDDGRAAAKEHATAADIVAGTYYPLAMTAWAVGTGGRLTLDSFDARPLSLAHATAPPPAGEAARPLTEQMRVDYSNLWAEVSGAVAKASAAAPQTGHRWRAWLDTVGAIGNGDVEGTAEEVLAAAYDALNIEMAGAEAAGPAAAEGGEGGEGVAAELAKECCAELAKECGTAESNYQTS